VVVLVVWLAVAASLACVLAWRLRTSLDLPEQRPVGLRFALLGTTFYGLMAVAFALHGEWILAAGHVILCAVFGRFAVIARHRRA
jgi:CHASE2 domain-containing sensor protein